MARTKIRPYNSNSLLSPHTQVKFRTGLPLVSHIVRRYVVIGDVEPNLLERSLQLLNIAVGSRLWSSGTTWLNKLEDSDLGCRGTFPAGICGHWDWSSSSLAIAFPLLAVSSYWVLLEDVWAPMEVRIGSERKTRSSSGLPGCRCCDLSSRPEAWKPDDAYRPKWWSPKTPLPESPFPRLYHQDSTTKVGSRDVFWQNLIILATVDSSPC